MVMWLAGMRFKAVVYLHIAAFGRKMCHLGEELIHPFVYIWASSFVLSHIWHINEYDKARQKLWAVQACITVFAFYQSLLDS